MRHDPPLAFTRTTALCCAAYGILAAISGVPFFARHAGADPLVPALLYALATSLGLAALLFHPRAAIVRGLAACRVFPWISAATLATVNLLLYPGTRRVAHPSSAPDAMTVPMQHMLQGLEPYAARLFDGAPISPGPGWILLNAPFTATGVISLLVPGWLALSCFLLTRQSRLAAGLLAALTLASLDFLQMSVVGHDIFAISLAFVAVCLAADRFRHQPSRLALVAVAAGLIATARLPLILLPLVIGLGLMRSHRPAGLTFTALALGTAIATHAVFAGWAFALGDFYQPLHLFVRAEVGAGPVFTGIGALAGLLAAGWIWRRMGTNPADWMLDCWLLQTGLFLPIGIGELVNVLHFDWSLWEGKNYVAYPLPLLAAALVLYGTRDRVSPS